MKVIEDVRLKYACDYTVKMAENPTQPIEKSAAGASVLAQVALSAKRRYAALRGESVEVKKANATKPAKGKKSAEGLAHIRAG